MKVKEKDIDISQFWENGDGPTIVKIKKLNYREILEIQDAVTVVEYMGKKAIQKPKMGLFRLKSLVVGIVDAPFEINEQAIGELEPALGDHIYAALDEFNDVTAKNSTGSGLPSKPEQETQS